MVRKQWEKEKMLVTSNFSFSHSVFKRLVSQGRQMLSLNICYYHQDLHPRQLHPDSRPRLLCLPWRLSTLRCILSRPWGNDPAATVRYRLNAPAPSIFMAGWFGNLLRAISPFPTVFSKGLFPRGVKRCHCLGMG